MQDMRPRQAVSKLDLVLGVPDTGESPTEPYPVVVILVDGLDLLALIGTPSYIGRRPGEILDKNFSLLPKEPARRVALYSHAIAFDYGRISALIQQSSDFVSWSDFAADGPSFTGPVSQLRGRRTETRIEQVVFDADQYATEVRRASSAREWESPGWRTAILLHKNLDEDPAALGVEWNLASIEPSGTDGMQFSAIFWHLGDNDLRGEDGIVVNLMVADGTAEERAAEMAGFLRSTPSSRWPVTRRLTNRRASGLTGSDQ